MNRDFVYEDRRSVSRVFATLSKWLWGALCCGVPGVPCYFCACCEKLDEVERDGSRVNQGTVTSEHVSRQHRPHAPRGRKSTPEMLSAVQCALSQLQGEPAPLLSASKSDTCTIDPGSNVTKV